MGNEKRNSGKIQENKHEGGTRKFFLGPSLEPPQFADFQDAPHPHDSFWTMMDEFKPPSAFLEFLCHRKLCPGGSQGVDEDEEEVARGIFLVWGCCGWKLMEMGDSSAAGEASRDCFHSDTAGRSILEPQQHISNYSG